MSMMGKIKNLLFTEEEETEEIPVINENPTPAVQESKPTLEDEIARFRNFNYEEKETPKVIEEKEVVREEIPIKREEKSPFQSFDEEEFERIAAINKNRLLERDRKLREEKERKREHFIKEEVKQPVKEQPRFVPSPVISPVYGILDKNYTKDDILPRASSDGTLPKIMDVDQVRKKAFGTLETLEKNLTNELDDIKITSFEDQIDEDVIVSGRVQEISIEDTKPLTKVDEDEFVDTKPLPKVEEDEFIDTKPLPKVEKDEFIDTEPQHQVKEEDDDIKTVSKTSKTNRSVDVEDVIEEVKKEDEEIDNDLFELIDSMYKDEEGE